MTDERKTQQASDEEVLLDHQYDGIQEYDNPMPRWWVWIYWGSFWFSLAYLFHYSVGNGVSVLAGYQSDAKAINAVRAEQALKEKLSEESLNQLMADTTILASGSEVFANKCVQCHLEKGQGSIGPNLTDHYWVHGKGTLMDIHQVVSEGSAAKGMPAWKQQLKPAELKAVVAFVGTLRGTNVEGKAPEGEAIE